MSNQSCFGLSLIACLTSLVLIYFITSYKQTFDQDRAIVNGRRQFHLGNEPSKLSSRGLWKSVHSWQAQILAIWRLPNFSWKLLHIVIQTFDNGNKWQRVLFGYLISAVNSDVEELDFAHVFSSSTEEAKSSEEYIHVCHETDGLDGVTRVTPSASMRIKPEKRQSVS